MVASLALALLAFRAGLRARRRRLAGKPPSVELRAIHLRFAKPAVIALMLGFVGGPVSAVMLRDWEAFSTFHAWLGVAAASLFAAAAFIGHQLEGGARNRAQAHGLLGALAVLAGAVAAVAGFVLLP